MYFFLTTKILLDVTKVTSLRGVDKCMSVLYSILNEHTHQLNITHFASQLLTFFLLIFLFNYLFIFLIAFEDLYILFFFN